MKQTQCGCLVRTGAVVVYKIIKLFKEKKSTLTVKPTKGIPLKTTQRA